MKTIEQLKAEAYDILAGIQQLQRALEAKNKEIADLQNKQVDVNPVEEVEVIKEADL